VNPLLSWTSADVWRYLATHDVPHNPLHAKGYPSIGCTPCTTAIRPGEDVRAGRWRGREKTECGLHVRPTEVHGEVTARRRAGYDSVPLAQGQRVIALRQAEHV
jgi:3'-phosphoadenosine 5'-phosphosulfate sulfotransferase (PAPS reductase)/FAD synthetase